MSQKFIKLPEVSSITGQSRSKIYSDINLQTFPTPIRIGRRAVAWIEQEIHAWMQARVDGKTDAEMQAFIASMIAARKSTSI